MNCDVALELISASLDGETTPEEETRLQEHLDQCPRCRAIQAELAGLSKALREDDSTPPTQLKEYILEHLPPQQSAKRPKVIRWTRWGAMAAAIALVALAAWRLPHSPAFDTDNAAPRSADTLTGSAVQDAALQDNGTALYGRSISGDTDLPAYVDGEAVSVNSIQADEPAAPQVAPAPAAKVSEAVQGPLEDEAAPPETKAITVTTTSADAMDATAASEFPAPTAGGSGDASAIQGRSAVLFSSTPTTQGEEVAVPEDVPELAGETPLSAEPFEEITEDVRDFSRYRAVVTLTTGGFESDEYPRQRQESGEMWYLLPADLLETLPQTLEADGLSCQVRTEGEDLTLDAQYVLLVVPGEG